MAQQIGGEGVPAVVGAHDEAGVRDFLQRYARAVTAGDGRAIAAMWGTPALVIGDHEVLAVSSPEEVARFFSTAKEQYSERGIVDTRPDILRLEWITDRIALCEVRWPYIDALGKEVGAESATYTLRRDPDRTLKVRTVILHGTSTRH